VECDPRGARPRPDVCDKAGVRKYPTWVVGGRKYEGVMGLPELAEASGYRGPASP
jgi:hypothetical protein